MLQFLIVSPLLFEAAVNVLPLEAIPCVGLFVPTGPMLQNETTLLSLPLVVPVENKMLPPSKPAGVCEEPSIVHLVILLFDASLRNLIVDVPEKSEIVLFVMVKELPEEFKPSMVTLSAPLRSIIGEPGFRNSPVTVLAPEGTIVVVFHAPSFNIAPPRGSAVLPPMVMLMFAPVCTPELTAVNAAASVA